MARLDEAIARHVEKWMKLSGPKLRDRWICGWPSSIRPGCGCRAKVEDNRYVEIVPAEVGDGRRLRQHSRRRRRRAGSASGCVGGHGVRERSAHQGSSAAPMRAVPLAARASQPGLPVRVASDCTGSGRSATPPPRRSFMCWPSRPPSTGPVISRAICPGSGFCPPSRCAKLAKSAKLKPVEVPVGAAPDPGYRPSAKTLEFVRWRDLTCRWPGCDQAGRAIRYRPHRAVAVRADASVEQQALLPRPPGAQAAYGRRNEFRRNPPLRRGDGEEMPFAGHALELVSAAVLELEP